MKIRLAINHIFNRVRRIWKDPALFVLGVIAPLAFVLVIIVPPFQAPDEHTHFFKAVQLSEGRPIGKYLGVLPGYPLPLVGDMLPAKYKVTADHYIDIRIHLAKKADVKQIQRDFTHPSTEIRRIPSPFENTVVYPPFAYIPQALTIAVVNVFCKNPLVQMYAARLSVLIVTTLLLFLAVRRLPFGKWALVALIATPMSLLLIGSCSGDGVTMGVSALFIAHVVAAVVNRNKLVRSELVWITALAVALGICKSPYQLLVFLVLVIPLSRFTNRNTYYRTLALAVALPLALAAIWALLVKKLYLNIVIDSNTANQTQYMLHHPLDFAHTLLRTYFGAAGDYVPRTFMDLSAGPSAPLPLWSVLLDYLFIAGLILLEPVQTVLTRGLKYVRLAAVLLIGAMFMALNTLLYVTFTPVMKPIIDGMQGRYFIPVSYLLVPLAGGSLATDEKRYVRLVSVFRWVTIFMACMAYLALIKRYY